MDALAAEVAETLAEAEHVLRLLPPYTAEYETVEGSIAKLEALRKQLDHARSGSTERLLSAANTLFQARLTLDHAAMTLDVREKLEPGSMIEPAAG